MSASLSPFLQALHKLSINHRSLVRQSQECGCFCCLRMFPSQEVSRWVDGGQTALCPACQVDAVLPANGLNRPLTREILESLSSAYFVGATSAGPYGPYLPGEPL